MKHLRVTVSVDPGRAPAFFTLLADSATIEEARLLEWNEARPERATMCYAVRGDPTELARSATETPGVDSVLILSDTSDATASVTISGSSRCMSPNVDEHVHVLVPTV